MKPRGYGKGSDWNSNRYGGFGRGKGMTRPSWLNDGKGKKAMVERVLILSLLLE